MVMVIPWDYFKAAYLEPSPFLAGLYGTTT